MYPERDKFIAKFLADISKLVIGAGIVAKTFSHDQLRLTGVILTLISSALLFIISLTIYPKE